MCPILIPEGSSIKFVKQQVLREISKKKPGKTLNFERYRFAFCTHNGVGENLPNDADQRLETWQDICVWERPDCDFSKEVVYTKYWDRSKQCVNHSCKPIFYEHNVLPHSNNESVKKMVDFSRKLIIFNL